MKKIKFKAWVNSLKTFKKIDAMYFNGNNNVYAVMIGDKPYALNNKEINILSCTGLKDKKGIEIFEGDIIKVYNIEEPFKVFFENSCFVVENTETSFFLKQVAEKCEVVGNIHENPNLINRD
ncbi:YopX family protein [Campylobacter sp. JMF_03 NE3]|uniref:YopX family protein n=1 Tax=Campylobacter sp. JMF_03 NE3 TaxID=2983831 RepID=UPI0022EA0288|nr:YopX family protein [Campylobacter sp. JMF_03 NE3]MDA3053563.1 YopX family protein [Campylobacter sp. JMF_03 NE3]